MFVTRSANACFSLFCSTGRIIIGTQCLRRLATIASVLPKMSVDSFDIASLRQAGHDNDDPYRNANGDHTFLSTLRVQSRLRCNREFGKYQDTHGWMRCRSKTYADRVYFYNMNSGCSTWHRPISCAVVDLPFVSTERTVSPFVFRRR